MSQAVEALPGSVRYVKNGLGSQWWKAAKAHGQIHLGWPTVSHTLLRKPDWPAIETQTRKEFGSKGGAATRDLKALRTLLDHPSRHLWVTFEDGCMWWCTVHDGIETPSDGDTSDRGHFWLTCAKPWSDESLGGRHLAMANLPGVITSTAGYRATVCEPNGWKEILRIIRDMDAVEAAKARRVYEGAIAKLVSRLRDKDFELLVDLILSRTGWARLAKLGGVTEGTDIEVENAATEEIAFVQIKSQATQSILNDYVSRFEAQRKRYNRMIFAVHKSVGTLTPPVEEPVQVWTGERIAQLVIRQGLGEWVAKRV
ncbi:hypothetical protein SAMN05519103_04009 [Rhizobiales bacterium GAS113]|nr:hypothetical protein SAMN05519103_04009 [Rhizobiales bacterium GAS113]